MERPAGVVVVVRAVVYQPSRRYQSPPHQYGRSRPAVVAGADRLQERVDDHLEEEPVVVPEALAVNAGQPHRNPRPLAVGEPVPDPRAAERQAERDLGGLDHRLRRRGYAATPRRPTDRCRRPGRAWAARSPGTSPPDPARRAAASRNVRAKASRPLIRRRGVAPRESGTKISAWVRLAWGRTPSSRTSAMCSSGRESTRCEARAGDPGRQGAGPAIGHETSVLYFAAHDGAGRAFHRASATQRTPARKGGEQQNGEGGGHRAGRGNWQLIASMLTSTAPPRADPPAQRRMPAPKPALPRHPRVGSVPDRPSGQDDARSGGVAFDPATYRVAVAAGSAPPFWSEFPGVEAVAFDVPHLSTAGAVAGDVRVSTWGTHSLSVRTASIPGLLREIDATFGRHPAFGDEHRSASSARVRRLAGAVARRSARASRRGSCRAFRAVSSSSRSCRNPTQQEPRARARCRASDGAAAHGGAAPGGSARSTARWTRPSAPVADGLPGDTRPRGVLDPRHRRQRRRAVIDRAPPGAPPSFAVRAPVLAGWRSAPEWRRDGDPVVLAGGFVGRLHAAALGAAVGGASPARAVAHADRVVRAARGAEPASAALAGRSREA